MSVTDVARFNIVSAEDGGGDGSDVSETSFRNGNGVTGVGFDEGQGVGLGIGGGVGLGIGGGVGLGIGGGVGDEDVTSGELQ